MDNKPSTSRFALGLSTKIIAASLGILLVVVAVNYVVFLNGYKGDAKEAMVQRASAFTAVADEAKNDASEKILRGEVNTEELLADALEKIDNGAHYSDTRYFASIPVITGWKTAEVAAEKENLDFKIVSLEARNPDNAPEKGSFRDTMIRDLTKQVDSGGEATISRINEETNALHFMRAITLNESCMTCHGDPAVYDEKDAEGNFDGKDALGFRMENWPVGYMHGAYEVEMPLEIMDAQVAGFFSQGDDVHGPARGDRRRRARVPHASAARQAAQRDDRHDQGCRDGRRRSDQASVAEPQRRNREARVLVR